MSNQPFTFRKLAAQLSNEHYFAGQTVTVNVSLSIEDEVPELNPLFWVILTGDCNCQVESSLPLKNIPHLSDEIADALADELDNKAVSDAIAQQVTKLTVDFLSNNPNAIGNQTLGTIAVQSTYKLFVKA